MSNGHGVNTAQAIKQRILEARDHATLWREQATTIIGGWRVKTTPYENLDDAPLESAEIWANLDALGEPAAGDEVVLAMMGTRPIVLGKLARATATQANITRDVSFRKHIVSNAGGPSVSGLTALGTTGAASLSQADDITGLVSLIPGGTGIAAGSLATLTFGNPYPSSTYVVQFTPRSSAARAYTGGSPGSNNHSTSSFSIDLPTALTSGSTYIWAYTILGRGV